MPKPYDATLNELIDRDAGQWADCFAGLAGQHPGPSVVLDTDLATTVQADRVFKIDGRKSFLLHLELEANRRLGIPADLLRYNTLVAATHNLPTVTVLVLLHRGAGGSDITGRFEWIDPNEHLITMFRYHVVRVWEQSAQFWLDAGVALAPLAVLTDEANAGLTPLVSALPARLRADGADEPTVRGVVASAYVLSGLRYNAERIAEAFGSLVMLLEDSTTYQAILRKGETQGLVQGISQGLAQGRSEAGIEATRRLVLRLGTKQFGAPDATTIAQLEAVVDPARLESLADRLLEVDSWQRLLGG